MKKIESVTGLVNCLFSAYEHNIRGLDWEEKIIEYADVINDFIAIDTDLNDLYMQIRQTFSNLPQPSAIKKMFLKQQTKSEIREYAEHPDNGKQIVIVCYRDEIPREVRVYTLAHSSTPTTKLTDVTSTLRERFSDIKIYEYGKNTSIYRDVKRLEDGTLYASAEAWVPSGYDTKGNITGYDKRRIA